MTLPNLFLTVFIGLFLSLPASARPVSTENAQVTAEALLGVAASCARDCRSDVRLFPSQQALCAEQCFQDCAKEADEHKFTSDSCAMESTLSSEKIEELTLN